MKTLYDKCVEMTEETLSEGHLVRTSLMRKMNLDKVSQDDFDKQYVNYNFYYGVAFRYSRLVEMSEHDGMLVSEDAETVVIELKQKYHIRDWQIWVDHRGNNVEFVMLVPNEGMNVKCILKDIHRLGYYAGGLSDFEDQKGQKWKVIQFEPYIQPNERELVDDYENIYHISPIENKESIKKFGIIAKSSDKEFKYPKRCYFVRGDAGHRDISNIIKMMYGRNDYGNIKGLFCVFTIKTKDIPKDIRFYYDGNCVPKCVFSDSSFSANLIDEIEVYDAVNDEWIDEETTFVTKIKRFFGFKY